MLKKMQGFIERHNIKDISSNDIIYVVPGGSMASGTNDYTSDEDIRCITLSKSDDYHIGMKNFDHIKKVDGINNINKSNDLDVEFFSADYFIKSAYKNEIIPMEMLSIEQNFILFKNEYFDMIIEKKDLFFSKKIIPHYKGFLYRCLNRMDIPIENFVKQESIDRVNLYNFETKEAMNAVKTSRIMVEFLETGILNIYRNDKDELLSIKYGKVSKKDILDEIQFLKERREILLKTSQVQDEPDFNAINKLYKEYKLYVLRKLNVI